MEMPLLDALLAHANGDPAPFHMPGHKGRMAGFPGLERPAALDVTELPDTGDLYVGADPRTGRPDPIAQAQALWAQAWGAPHCQFLTGGSTQGLHAALLLCARGTDRSVLVDRCCHRSVYNALGMWDLDPLYLPRRQDRPIPPEAVAAALDAAAARGREVKTICITSPTYYGVLSDIPALAQVVHRRGGRLIVDAAHGCHLPFLMEGTPFAGADLVVSSAHKTMSAYGQGALLFANESFTPRDLRWAASVCGTSSPSYPILASLDWARARAERPEGVERLRWAAAETAALRRDFPALDGPETDPLRLTLLVRAGAADGRQVAELLRRRGVWPEMADRDHVVFLLGGENTREDLRRLRAGLEEAARTWPGVYGPPLEPPEPPAPEVVLSPAAAMSAARRTLRPLGESAGAVCLQQVAPYPPGVPVIAPGERVTKKGLAYLREVGYNVREDVSILDEEKEAER